MLQKVLESILEFQNITIYKDIASSYKALLNKEPDKHSELCKEIATLKFKRNQYCKNLETTTDELQYKNVVLNETRSELEKLTASEEYKAAIIDQYASDPDETSPNPDNLIENDSTRSFQNTPYSTSPIDLSNSTPMKMQPKKPARCMPTCIIS